MQRLMAFYVASIPVQMILLSLMTFVSLPAMAQTVVEQRIALLQPCNSLRTEANVLGLPVTIGIDTLKSVTLSRAEAVMVGNEVTLNFTGGLACRTSDSAVIKGEASVDLVASTVVDLANCSIQSLSITPTQFGGTFGQILEGAWQPLIKPKLEKEATQMIKDACTGFVTGQ